MAVQMPRAGLLSLHRLVRISTSSQRLLSRRDALGKLHEGSRDGRTLSTASVKCNKNDSDPSDPSEPAGPSGLSAALRSREALASRRRRPLSPLERISSLVPPDALSPEVMQLREEDQREDADIQTPAARCTPEENGHEDGSEAHCASAAGVEPDTPETRSHPALPGESSLAFGEVLIAERRKKGQVEFRKMFQLQERVRLQSNWGTVLHDDIAGQPAGRFLKTSLGVPILIRRASLEEYVLHMRRGPTIAYPKDAAVMLMMMDIHEGHHVLESGSGSGAMSLFLSRAVGSKGSVLSVEIREDHQKRAVLNYRRWRASWSLRRGEEWPDNVRFHNGDLSAASELLAGQGFHAVALDMINPHLVLPTVIPHLHPGAVCAVYLANVTQVIDLLEGLRCAPLPLLCERIIEVPIRDWLVAPAVQKDGRFCTKKAPVLPGQREGGEAPHEADDEGEVTPVGQPAFGSVPYLARPHPEQMSHTAFLVKLRKCEQ